MEITYNTSVDWVGTGNLENWKSRDFIHLPSSLKVGDPPWHEVPPDCSPAKTANRTQTGKHTFFLQFYG